MRIATKSNLLVPEIREVMTFARPPTTWEFRLTRSINMLRNRLSRLSNWAIDGASSAAAWMSGWIGSRTRRRLCLSLR